MPDLDKCDLDVAKGAWLDVIGEGSDLLDFQWCMDTIRHPGRGDLDPEVTYTGVIYAAVLAARKSKESP